MDVELMSWKNEMDNMLAAINRQTAHSLRVIRLIFKRCGRSLPPEFKQYFLQTSSHSIKTTYEQFETDSLLEQPMDVNLSSVANVAGGSLNDRRHGLKFEANNGENGIQIDDYDDAEVVVETIETAFATAYSHQIECAIIANQNLFDPQNFNNDPIAIDDLYGTNGSFVRPSNSIKHHYMNDPEDSSDSHFADASNDSKFAVEMNDSNDSIEMVENRSDSTDADDNEFNPVAFDLNRSDKSTSVGLIEYETCPLDRKNLHEKRMMKTKETSEGRDLTRKTNGKISSTNQSKPNNRLTCTVCGYVGLHLGNLNRHMRTHTGEKPYRCDRCERRFTNSKSLLNHAAVHIADFPFHCRVCFRGFSSKAEAVAHEKHCHRRRYECHLCKKFVTCIKHDLVRHMRKHSGDKPFRCNICMKTFGWKYVLQRHLNNIHTESS